MNALVTTPDEVLPSKSLAQIAYEAMVESYGDLSELGLGPMNWETETPALKKNWQDVAEAIVKAHTGGIKS